MQKSSGKRRKPTPEKQKNILKNYCEWNKICKPADLKIIDSSWPGLRQPGLDSGRQQLANYASQKVAEQDQTRDTGQPFSTNRSPTGFDQWRQPSVAGGSGDEIKRMGAAQKNPRGELGVPRAPRWPGVQQPKPLEQRSLLDNSIDDEEEEEEEEDEGGDRPEDEEETVPGLAEGDIALPDVSVPYRDTKIDSGILNKKL